MAQDGQLIREARKGRQARKELTLIEEHVDRERQRLFGLFCDRRNDLELYDLQSQAIALTNLEEFLQELVTTGILAEKQNEGDDI
jgi:hypothetical protein